MKDGTNVTLNPLATPIRADTPDESYAWRDNAYLGFWDSAHDVYGVAHVSTSPNAPGRRARVSVQVDGRSVEVVEDLEPGSFTSESIEFDLSGAVRVRHPSLSLELSMTPVGPWADYTAGEVMPPLVPGEPLHHYQQGASVVGAVECRGEVTEFQADGIRDRTWGFRDDSAAVAEYVAVILRFEDTFLTVMKFRGNDGADRTEGFVLGDPVVAVPELRITRDASGMVVQSDLRRADGAPLSFRRAALLGGFWVPLGAERAGPTLSAYDEFVEVRTTTGSIGHGIVEQGVRRQLW